MPHAQPEE
jgi:hypothetical protein